MTSSSDGPAEFLVPPAAFERRPAARFLGVLVLLNGVVTLLNPEAEALWGVPAAAVLGNTPAAVLPAVLPAPLLQLLQPEPASPPVPRQATCWLPHTGHWLAACTAPAPDGTVWVYWENIAADTGQPDAKPATAPVAMPQPGHSLAAAALHQAHEGLVGVLESTHDALYTLDAGLRFTYVNHQAAQLWGREPGTLVGRVYEQEFPQAVGSELYHQHQRVLQSRQPAHFETVSPVLGNWISVSIYPGQEDSLWVFFRDITARKQAEGRQDFLLQLNDALRPLQSSVAIQQAAAELLGKYLGVSRAYYAEVLADDDTMLTRAGYFNGVSSLVGTLSFADFAPDLRQLFLAGTTRVLNDVHGEPAPSAARLAMFASLQLCAGIGVPLVKEGRLEAILTVHQATPRTWTAAEISLLEDVAERTWAAVERASAEEARCRAEEKFRLFVTTSADTLYRMSPDWRQMLTLDGKNFLAHTDEPSTTWVEKYLPAADQASTWAAIHAAIASKQPFSLEHRVYRADGSVGWTSSRAVPVLDARGDVTEWFGAATDITARKQAEAALRQSEERLQLALQAGHMGSFEWTSEDNYLRLSPMSKEVLGLRPEAPFATSDAGFTLVHPDDRARQQAVFEQARRTGEDFHSIYRIVRPRDGQVRWLEERGQGTHEPATGRTTLRGVHWDVTEVILAQRQLADFNAQLEQRVARRTRDLQASRDLLQSIFDTNLVALSVLEAVRDATGTVQDFRLRLVSRELARATGRADLVGKRCIQEYPGLRAAGIFELAVRTVETGRPHSTEYHYRHQELDKWYACQFVKLGDGVVATSLDITERKAAERETLRQQVVLFEAVQAAQEAERKRIAEGLHNGIGQILYATKLRLSHLDAPLLHQNPALVAALRQSEQLLSEAISQTRQLSHELVPMTLADFGLPASLRDICRKMSTQQLRFHCEAQLDAAAPALSPALQLALYRMTQELVQNVAKHAHGATEARVELETTPDWVLLRVEDNGPGFAARFTPSPLGLRAVRDRTTLLGGLMQTGTLGGSGAYVRIRLPLAAGPPA